MPGARGLGNFGPALYLQSWLGFHPSTRCAFAVLITLAVATTQDVFGRSDIRLACIPGARGIMNARSQACFCAMLANGGELDGVRLLSEHRVRTFHVPHPPSDYDPVSGTPHNGTIGGFHFAGSPGMGAMGYNPLAFGHNGAGGSLGWADPTHRLAVAIQHNRMVAHGPPVESPLTPTARQCGRRLAYPSSLTKPWLHCLGDGCILWYRSLAKALLACEESCGI